MRSSSQRLEGLRLMALARRQLENERPALALCPDVQLGGKASLAAAQRFGLPL